MANRSCWHQVGRSRQITFHVAAAIEKARTKRAERCELTIFADESRDHHVVAPRVGEPDSHRKEPDEPKDTSRPPRGLWNVFHRKAISNDALVERAPRKRDRPACTDSDRDREGV